MFNPSNFYAKSCLATEFNQNNFWLKQEIWTFLPGKNMFRQILKKNETRLQVIVISILELPASESHWYINFVKKIHVCFCI